MESFVESKRHTKYMGILHLWHHIYFRANLISVRPYSVQGSFDCLGKLEVLISNLVTVIC